MSIRNPLNWDDCTLYSEKRLAASPAKPRVGSSCIGGLFLIPTSLQSGIVSSRLCSFLQTFAFSASPKWFPVLLHHCRHQHSVWVGRSFDFIVSSLILVFSFAECMPHNASCVDGTLSSDEHFRSKLDLFPWLGSLLADGLLCVKYGF